METFSALLALYAGNWPVTGYSPHKGQRRGAFVFSMMCTWAGGWVNIRDVRALRRHRAHYDVAVMHLDVHDMNIAQILSSNMVISEFNFRIDHLN